MKLKMRRYGDYESDNTGVGDMGQTVVRRYALIQRIRENRTKRRKIKKNIEARCELSEMVKIISNIHI